MGSYGKSFTRVTRIFPKLGLRTGIVRHKLNALGSYKNNNATLIEGLLIL